MGEQALLSLLFTRAIWKKGAPGSLVRHASARDKDEGHCVPLRCTGRLVGRARVFGLSGADANGRPKPRLGCAGALRTKRAVTQQTPPFTRLSFLVCGGSSCIRWYLRYCKRETQCS